MIFWEIYIDENREQCLYYPGDSLCAIVDPVLTERLNSADELKFTLAKKHPLYNSVTPRITRLYCYKNGNYANPKIFEVIEAQEYLKLTKSIYAVGELSDLFCSIQPQARYQNVTPASMFQQIIEQHNSQVEEKKRFEVGIVTVTDPNDSIYRYTNFEPTIDVLREDLCKSLNGYLRIRHLNDKRYLDLVKLSDYGKRCDQPIEFGVNLLDYSKSITSSDLATAIIPIGAKKEDSEGNIIQDIPGLDSYVTIESINNGLNYIYSEEAVKQYGWVRKVVEWNDVTQPENLLRKAQEYLSYAQFTDLTLELGAIDLSMLGTNINSMDLGDYVEAMAYPFNLDMWLPIQEKVTKLQDASQNIIVLSNTIKAGYIEQTKTTNTNLENKLPQESTILETAKRNATKLINGNGEKGNVVIHTTDDGIPYEILIMDKPNIKDAKKIWRWNLSGFAYSDDGGKTYGTAITIDGQIVADFITAGTMYADRIRGGDLVIGGLGTGKDGQILGYDQYGNETFILNKNGARINGNLTASTITDSSGKEVKVSELVQASVDAAKRAEEALISEKEAKNSAAASAQSASNSANSAESSAQSASRSEYAASLSANYAQQSADNANQALDSANIAANASNISAQESANAATSASSAAASANESAANASNSASSASDSASSAWDASQSAEEARINAQDAANSASDSASSASDSANSASASEANALSSAASASQSQVFASESAASASSSATNAAESQASASASEANAILANSYAQQAMVSASQSATDAGNANAFAQQAMSNALQSATDASNANTAAQNSANSAFESATNASNSASSAWQASQSAEEAKNAAESAKNDAVSAKDAAASAKDAAERAESAAAESAGEAEESNQKVREQMERFIPPGHNPSYLNMIIGGTRYKLWGYIDED